MKINIKKLIPILATISLAIVTFGSGYSISKKIYSPKKVSGNLYIDYTENSSHPNIYLDSVDYKTFTNNSPYILLSVTHVRK